jgi:hypothetical protein
LIESASLTQQARCRAVAAEFSLIYGQFCRSMPPIHGALQYYYCTPAADPRPRFHLTPRIR